MARLITMFLLLTTAEAQLRPRRVGTSATGEQEMAAEDLMAAARGGGGLDALGGANLEEAMAKMAQAFGGGAGGLDPETLLKGMDPANNPLLKGMAESNPELKALLENPDALKAQMAQMTEMMQSGEGQEMMGKMMSEMQNVLTDPEKLKEGLAQLSNNPMLKGLADAVPGLREVLDDPEALEEQATKTAELFQAMQDPEKAKEMLETMAGGEGGEALAKMQEMLGSLSDGEGGLDLQALQQKMLELMGGEGGDAAAMMQNLMGGMGGDDSDGAMGGDAMKARVREQLAAMMQNQGGGAGALDEEF